MRNTSLIPLINATINTETRYSCVTRCRRFGKFMSGYPVHVAAC